MATTRGGEPAPGPTREEQAETIIRTAISGHPQGAVRRIVLYVVMFACMGIAFYASVLIVPALIAGVLLLATDVVL